MSILSRHQNATAKRWKVFEGFFAEYLKNGSTNFHQIMPFFNLYFFIIISNYN